MRDLVRLLQEHWNACDTVILASNVLAFGLLVWSVAWHDPAMATAPSVDCAYSQDPA